MRTHLFLFSALALTLTAAAGCDSGTEPEAPETECTDAATPGCVVRSDKQRIMSPDVPAEDLEAAVAGNSAFAMSLYKQLQSEPGNLFYSPHSISVALSMTWAGARAQTEQDMAATLGFTLPQTQHHPAFNALDLALASRGQNAEGANGQPFKLSVANALWAQTSYPFEAAFLDTLGLSYGAGVHVVDFEGQPADAIDLINDWVDTETNGKITKLVDSQSVNNDTRFVLTNAIYFNAAWAKKFDPDSTADGSFYLADGSKITVPMMHGSRDAAYAEGDGFQAVVLPYSGGEVSMVVVLPEEGKLADLESSLGAKTIDDIVESTDTYSVDLTMPKFEIDGDFSLREVLSGMGMEVAFTAGADFTGISKEGGLVLQDVVHKSFITLNESGTEAAAATAVSGGTTSAPPPAEMTIDRPFLFVIRDNPTGALLFVGRVADPSK